MQRIVVVDDDPELVDLMITILRDEGYETAGFTSASEALVAMAHDAPALAFIDLSMPDVDGPQLCRALKADPGTAAIKLVLLSGACHVDREAALAGADAHLQKPFDLDEMADLVARLSAPRGRESSVSS